MSTCHNKESKDFFDHYHCPGMDCDCSCHEPRTLSDGFKFEENSIHYWSSSMLRPYREVWRIEDKNGNGPFKIGAIGFNNGNHKNEHVFKHNKKPILHVGPDECWHPDLLRTSNFYKEWLFHDKWYYYKSDFIYGLKNKSQLRFWFSRQEWKRLQSYGFRLVKRKASFILYSKIQVAFVPYCGNAKIENGLLMCEDDDKKQFSLSKDSKDPT